MAIQHPAIRGRGDLPRVDPEGLQVREGWNSRTEFGDLEALKEFTIANGVQVPLIVQKIKQDIFIVDGERRWRSCIMAIKEGHVIESVPCFFVDPKLSQMECMVIQLGSNAGKEFTPLEEADAFRRLHAWGMKVSQIAIRMGKSPQFVRDRLTLVNADQETRQALEDGTVGVTAAVQKVKEVQRQAGSRPSRKPANHALERKTKSLAKKLVGFMEDGKFQPDLDPALVESIKTAIVGIEAWLQEH